MNGATEPRDVLVVGGGPAGAAAAITLARVGADVLLVERRSMPRPKVCGGCLGPRALACLDRLGLDARALPGAAPLESVRVAVAHVATTLPLPAGVVVDRAQLDAHLLQRVRQAGASVWSPARAHLGNLDRQPQRSRAPGRRLVRVETGKAVRQIAARVVLLATGLRPGGTPAPRARVGLSQTRASDGRCRWGRELPPAQQVWMSAGPSGYVGMVRYGDGRLNVAASVRAAAMQNTRPGNLIDAILEAAGVAPLGWAEGWHGTPPLRAQSLRDLPDRVLRIGDAAGFWEPFTGEGIGWSLESGIHGGAIAATLAPAWCRATAVAWVRQRRRWMRRVQRRSRRVSMLADHPRLAVAALRLAAVAPSAGRWLVSRATPSLPSAGSTAATAADPHGPGMGVTA